MLHSQSFGWLVGWLVRSKEFSYAYVVIYVGVISQQKLTAINTNLMTVTDDDNTVICDLIMVHYSSAANHHLSKTIELSRIHLFNIVTQYRAIFSDDDPILPLAKDQNINESAIFYSWITEKVGKYPKVRSC
jgi:hypothetical protein